MLLRESGSGVAGWGASDCDGGWGDNGNCGRQEPLIKYELARLTHVKYITTYTIM